MGMTIEKGSALEKRLQQQARQPDPYAYRDQAKAFDAQKAVARQHFEAEALKLDAIMCKSVVELGEPQPQRRTPKALVHRDAPGQIRARRPLVCITLVSYRKRKLDWSNLVAGFKDLQDAIAAKLGIDDGSPLLAWEYDQIVTIGSTGTQILITLL